MRIYLFLALFWLMVALFMLLYPLYYPDAQSWTILDTRVSAGWLLLLLAAWNLMRWRLTQHLNKQDDRATTRSGEPQA